MKIPNDAQTKKSGKRTMKKTNTKRTKVHIFSFNLMKVNEDAVNKKINEFLKSLTDPKPDIDFDRDDVSLLVFVEYTE